VLRWRQPERGCSPSAPSASRRASTTKCSSCGMPWRSTHWPKRPARSTSRAIWTLQPGPRSSFWQSMRRPDGRLWHTWRNGKAHGEAFLDDYAGLVQALVTLYEATFDERHIDRAIALADILLAHFLDRPNGGFYFTADDHEQLIARQKPMADESVPSGNGLAAMGLLRLGKLTSRQYFIDAALARSAPLRRLSNKYPQAAGQMLLALDFHLGPRMNWFCSARPASRQPPACWRKCDIACCCRESSPAAANRRRYSTPKLSIRCSQGERSPPGSLALRLRKLFLSRAGNWGLKSAWKR